MMKKIYLTLFLLFLANNAHATNFYISPNGLGSKNGTSPENSYAAAGGAGFNTALAAAACGDHIIFIKGYGSFTTTLNVNKSGCIDAAKTFTVVAATDVFTSTAHGYSNGDMVKLSTTSALPSFSYRDEYGNTVATFNNSSSTGQGYQSEAYFSYIVSDVTANTFKLQSYEGGPAIDVTDTGVGVQSVAKINFIYIEGEGSGTDGTVIAGGRDTPESVSRIATGSSGFVFSNGVSNIKISNLRADRFLRIGTALLYENNRIYFKDIFVDHSRETFFVRGYKNCTIRDHEYNCLPGSHGWIIDNVDNDYVTKHYLRSEMGMHDSTISNARFNGRNYTEDFNFGIHIGTGSGSTNGLITYQNGTGALPTEGATLTGATSGATRTIVGYVGNQVLGGAVKGTLQLVTGTNAFTVGETITDGTGFSATVLTYANSSTTNLSHNFLIYNVIAQNALSNTSASYDNGDGFVSENSSHDVIYIGCSSFDNNDGGWDAKGWNHKIINARCARDGNRCIRFWYGPNYVSNSIITYAGQGDLTQYAAGSNSCIWVGGVVTYDNISCINSTPLDIDAAIIRSFDYSGGTGGLPVVTHSLFSQTDGDFVRVIAYTGNAVSGKIYYQFFNSIAIGEVMAGDGFSATITSLATTACPPYTITDSLIYQDLDHATYRSTWPGTTCASSGTLSNNIFCIEGGTCASNPSLVNAHDKYWEGENNSFNPTAWSVVGIGASLPVVEPNTHIRTIGGSATIGQ